MKWRMLALVCAFALVIASIPVVCLVSAQDETYRMGDVNDDEEIDMKDVLAIRKHIASAVNPVNTITADVNADEEIDMKDVLAIRKRIANIPVDFSQPRPEPYFAAETDTNNGSLGAWWWDCTYARLHDRAVERLEFLQKNHCTEIYVWFDYQIMTKEEIAEFVRLAAGYGIRVAWLSGDVYWIMPENEYFSDMYADFKAYQEWAPNDAKLYALHLDVEPHQLPGTEDGWQLYATFANNVCSELHTDGYRIEWDIPYWTDTIVVDFGNQVQVPLTKALMNVSDCVTLMSYRDTAHAILECGKEEIEWAKESNCKLILGAETGKTSEGDRVTFYEEGKGKLYNELAEVLATLAQSNIPGGYGVAIHQVESWKNLKKGSVEVTTKQNGTQTTGSNTSDTSTTVSTTTTTTSTTTTTTMTTTTTTQNNQSIRDRSAYALNSSGAPYLTFQDPTADGTTLGTWWWFVEDAFDNNTVCEKYLSFLEENRVTEIYFYGYDYLTGNSKRAKLHGFVQKAMNHGMGVAIINEDTEITEAGNTVMQSIVSNYLGYVSAYPDDNMLGIHFDVEHVSVQKFANNMVSQFDYATSCGVPIAMDVNCEMDIETQLTVGGVTGNIYEVIAAHCTTLTLMSYRDSYEAIMELGDAAYKAALKYNCQVVFAVETGRYDFNPQDWEFYQETAQYMYEEMQKIYLDLVDTHPQAGFGMAIHQHKTWYELCYRDVVN